MVVLKRDPIAPEVASDRDSRSIPIFDMRDSTTQKDQKYI
jgi:hypothetical protein